MLGGFSLSGQITHPQGDFRAEERSASLPAKLADCRLEDVEETEEALWTSDSAWYGQEPRVILSTRPRFPNPAISQKASHRHADMLAQRRSGANIIR